MILRIWRAGLDPARMEGYRRFEVERCLPMLRRQPGLLGVLLLRESGDRAASVTIWEDGGAVEALESSPSYRETARELAESGLLAGERSVEAFEVARGTLRPEPLISFLGATEAQPPRGKPRHDADASAGRGRPELLATVLGDIARPPASDIPSGQSSGDVPSTHLDE